MKTLRKSAQSIGLDATKPLERQKSIRGKPVLRSLRSKRLADVLRLSLAGLAIQSYEKIRRPQIAIVLWDFVFQDEVATKCIPRQLADHPMILVKVVAAVGQNQIGRKLFLQLFEFSFDTSMERREIAIAVIPDHYLLRLRAAEEQPR